MRNSNITCMVKMESVSRTTIFGLKRKVKNGLEIIILKSLHGEIFFPYFTKKEIFLTKITNLVTKLPFFLHGVISIKYSRPLFNLAIILDTDSISTMWMMIEFLIYGVLKPTKGVSDLKAHLSCCENPSRSCENLNFCIPSPKKPFLWLRSQCC